MNKNYYFRKYLHCYGIIMFCIFLLHSCGLSYWDYAELAIQNNLSSSIQNVSIIYRLPWKDESVIVEYSDLFSGQKSDYTTIKSGYQFNPSGNGVSSYAVMQKMEINYTINGYFVKQIVFEDSFDEYAYSYDSIPEECYSKVFIKKDSLNTIIITEDGKIKLTEDD